MIDLKRIAMKILLEKQKEAPPDIDQHSFFYQELDIAAIGSVFSVGDGHIQIADHPSPLLLKLMKHDPGLSVSHVALKQQCRLFLELWVNTISTGQGCGVLNNYKRRNIGPYPALPRRYESDCYSQTGALREAARLREEALAGGACVM